LCSAISERINKVDALDYKGEIRPILNRLGSKKLGEVKHYSSLLKKLTKRTCVAASEIVFKI